jgi:hypothetical protein
LDSAVAHFGAAKTAKCARGFTSVRVSRSGIGYPAARSAIAQSSAIAQLRRTRGRIEQTIAPDKVVRLQKAIDDRPRLGMGAAS